MFQQTGGFSGQRARYVPNAAASRRLDGPTYVRPTRRYGSRTVPVAPIRRPIVPAGRGPGGAGLLAAILGPIGGLTGCLCCLNTIGIWGLFITAIPLTVFISRWYAAFKNRAGGTVNGAEELFGSQLLLLVLLVCSFLYTFMRRS